MGARRATQATSHAVASAVVYAARPVIAARAWLRDGDGTWSSTTIRSRSRRRWSCRCSCRWCRRRQPRRVVVGRWPRSPAPSSSNRGGGGGGDDGDGRVSDYGGTGGGGDVDVVVVVVVEHNACPRDAGRPVTAGHGNRNGRNAARGKKTVTGRTSSGGDQARARNQRPCDEIP